MQDTKLPAVTTCAWCGGNRSQASAAACPNCGEYPEPPAPRVRPAPAAEFHSCRPRIVLSHGYRQAMG